MIKETIIKESISLIFAIASNAGKKAQINLDVNQKDIEEALNHHIRIVKNWSNEITFKDLSSSKQTTSIYIPLNLFVFPRRIRINSTEKIKSQPLLDIFNNSKNHIAILGQPGAGKTTSMKFICQSIFFQEDFYPEQFNYPVLIKLREFNHPIRGKKTAGILYEYLFNLFGLKLSTSVSFSQLTDEQIINFKRIFVLEIIEKLKILLIIEGFDELVFKKHRKIIIEELTQLVNYMETSKLVITSRTADYNYSIENISVFEICPLNQNQIDSFAVKWLGKYNSKKFLQEIKKSPYNDTSIRPLTVAHLCAIYERIGKIPEKPKTVYKKIINLLLEEWDEQRGIIRNSKYSMFEIDRKFDFLSNLAYHLTIRNRSAIFSRDNLLNVYNDIFIDFDLKKDESKAVINDIESHTGLFIQAGYEFYEFAHKSLQEYLSAEYIVKLPYILTQKRLIQRIPNELAITVTISSNPSLYFVELIDKVFYKMDLAPEFINKFINRLLLEKPDFNKNDKVALSALKLYSKYMSIINDSNTQIQLSLFKSDYLVKEYEKFIDSIFKRNSKEIIKVIYKEKVKDYFETLDDTSVYLLEKKEVFSDCTSKKFISEELYKEMPKLLYCRSTFSNSFIVYTIEP